MTADALKDLLAQPIALLVLMYLAALVSALQQISDSRHNGGDVYSLGEYLRYWPETLAVVLGNLLAFAVLVFSDQLNFASALGIGYGSNFAADTLRRGGRSDGLAPVSAGDQAGFVRPAMLGLLLALGMFSFTVLPGCSSTRAAYAQADSAAEYGYVIAENYAALVHEAANLAENPATDRQLVKAMQQADSKMIVAIRELNAAEKLVADIRNAETEAQLQLAIDNAVRLLADLLRTVQTARGAPR